ncbi:MAG: sodium-dependent transporter [Thermoanaerobaculia bacterium]|nr:sodium-dependent transporter [Thermoanaerobaculia bacterium]
MSRDSARGSWASGLGFVLAAAGSAVGLGNVWRFPYITGENGGGLFVLIYLGAIALVGLPVMIGEILIGRAAQRSTVSAFKVLAGPTTRWRGLGWLGVVAAYSILSFYGVVAGWTLHYTLLSAGGTLAGKDAAEIQLLFQSLDQDGALSLLWFVLFMAATVAVVLGGVRRGIERWSVLLMPALLLMMLGLLWHAARLEAFPRAFDFVFGFDADKLTPAGVLEALGHAFFTLSVGMGGMLTYGSYLSRRESVVGNALAVGALDTLIALIACLIIFPITFSFGMEPAAGPGLIFASLPIAFAQMPAGRLLATTFFSLLLFAALTSAISLLEVAAAFFIDEKGWSRRKATIVSGLGITLLGVPAALTGSTRLFGADFARLVGKEWFAWIADLASNWMLPVGGFLMAVFAAWILPERMRHQEFVTGTRLGRLYRGWLLLLRYFVPLAVVAVFLHSIGLI